MDVLVEAERKFLTKLCNAMTPVMNDAFFDLFLEAKKISQGRKVLIQYQTLLKEVQNWNNTMVKQHTDAIIKSCAMFSNLLAAVFVISVKIMSAVRISTESRKMNIKLPTNDVFVHSCYIAAAKNLYEDPYVIVDEMSDTDRRQAMSRRFEKCIKDVVDDFIPVQQILETYIPNFTGGDLDIDHGTSTDPADPETVEGDISQETPTDENMPQTPVVEAPPVPEAQEVPSVENEAVAPGEPAPPETPVKTVKVHHETLFDDAADEKK